MKILKNVTFVKAMCMWINGEMENAKIVAGIKMRIV